MAICIGDRFGFISNCSSCTCCKFLVDYSIHRRASDLESTGSIIGVGHASDLNGMEIIDLINPDWPDFDASFRRVAESASPREARIGRMMLDLLESLRQSLPGTLFYASVSGNEELWLSYCVPGQSAATMIKIAVDAPDYGPLENGLPRFHYRLSYKFNPPGGDWAGLPTEERLHSVQAACQFVVAAVEQARNYF